MADFADLHREGAPLLLPNAWDVASAAALVDAGFEAVGSTSLGVAAAAGRPDGAGVALAETLTLAERLRPLRCHVSVDLEAGSVEAAAAAASAGAAGVNVEDGRAGRGLVPLAEHAALVREVKEQLPGLFVNARTDTFWLGAATSLDETLRRAEAYLAAGCDGIFVPGLVDLGDVSAVVRALAPAPLNILFAPGRHTFAELADVGVRRVSLGSLLFRAGLDAAVRTARAVADGTPVSSGIPSYGQVQSLIAGVVPPIRPAP